MIVHKQADLFVVTNGPPPSLTDLIGPQIVAKDASSGHSEEPRHAFPEIVTRALHVKAIDEEKRIVDFVASTDVVDAHDEIVDQASWILDDYLKNPVVLFAHNARELPIGRAIDVAVRSSGGGIQLETRIEFATKELNPKAEEVFRMIQAKYLRAVSVGFVPRSYRWEMRAGVEVWVWADCVLKEISVTPVPANPEALAKMKSLAPRAVTQQRPAAPGPNTKDGAPPRKEESMDPKELQDRLEKMTAAKALTDEALKDAEKATRTAEDSAKELASKVKALETDKIALEAQTKTLAADRDAAVARAEKAEGQIIELDVDALVGKKITAAEKPLFVDLRKSNAALFEKMIAQRADMKLTESITEKDAKNGTPAVVGDTSDLLAEITTSVAL